MDRFYRKRGPSLYMCYIETDDVNGLAAQMEAETRAEMRAEGFTDADIEVQRSADCRFLGQSYELNLPLPSRPLTVDDAPRIAQAFFELYERTYGTGTAWQGVPTQLLTLTITVTGRRPHPEVRRAATQPTPAAEMQTGMRAPDIAPAAATHYVNELDVASRTVRAAPAS